MPERTTTIKQMKRGETGYTQSWASNMEFRVHPKPGGTADTLVRRKWWGFEFVGVPKDPKRWVWVGMGVIYFGSLIGGLVGMAITKAVTGDAADPPFAIGLVLVWAAMTIIGLVGMLNATA